MKPAILIILILILVSGLAITGCRSDNLDETSSEATATSATTTYENPLSFDMQLDDNILADLTVPEVTLAVPEVEIDFDMNIPFDPAVTVPSITLPDWSTSLIP